MKGIVTFVRRKASCWSASRAQPRLWWSKATARSTTRSDISRRLWTSAAQPPPTCSRSALPCLWRQSDLQIGFNLPMPRHAECSDVQTVHGILVFLLWNRIFQRNVFSTKFHLNLWIWLTHALDLNPRRPNILLSERQRHYCSRNMI